MNLVKPDSVTTTGAITRSTTGTYVDSAGVIQTAAINAVRINHDPSTKEFLGILIENASTNLLTYSHQFDNAAWNKYASGTISANAITAPDGNLTADLLIWTSATLSGIYQITESAFVSSMSVYAKAASGSPIILIGDGSGVRFATFDLVTGTCINTLGTSSSIIPVGNGWYRLVVVFLTAPQSTKFISGTGVAGSAYIWGAQLEAGALPTSYIPTVASQVTRAADIITGSGLVYSTLTESNPEWSSATTYALGANVVYGIYGTYQSLQSGNLNRTPPITSPFTDAYWVRTGPTNKMAMFDEQISSVSSGTTDIIFAVVASSIDSVALFNITAGKTNIAVTDKDTKVLAYNNSQQLSGGESLDWYSYFFYDSDTQKTSSIYLDIPPVANSLITIKVSGTGTVSVGSYINGQIKYLGNTQYGVSAGIIDYSRKDTDEFGNTTFTKRNFSKRMNASVSLTNSNLNRVQRILYGLRATPVLWIASTDAQFEEPLIIYGFYRDFSTEISYPTHSICNLQVEGLI
jgi:hypothetical protein